MDASARASVAMPPRHCARWRSAWLAASRVHAATVDSPAGSCDSRRVNAVSVRGLQKRYGDLEAVRGIDLEVQAGEIFGFLGPNGAGKSTTIKVLCTLATPTAGEARVA